MGQSDPNMTPMREGRPDSTDNTVLTFTVTLAVCWERNIPKLHCTAATQVSLSQDFPAAFSCSVSSGVCPGTGTKDRKWYPPEWNRVPLCQVDEVSPGRGTSMEGGSHLHFH